MKLSYLNLILILAIIGCGAPPDTSVEPDGGPAPVECPNVASTSFTVTIDRDDVCPVGARTFDGTLAFDTTPTATLTFAGWDDLIPCAWSQVACDLSVTCDTPTRIIRWALVTPGSQLTGSGYSTELGACVTGECNTCLRTSYSITGRRTR